MTQRRPLVIGPDGLSQQLQAGDTTSVHGKFTGTSTFGFSISLGQTQTSTLAVTPAVSGDSLAAGEDISLMPTAALPAGINIAFFFVSATNTVTIGFTSSALITLSSTTISWRVTAHR
ncbi:hypothetical protein [Beijerinckia sp. L45]|uniref:hypothetical protein n=1 Tax=Beijerinckia sp. L45 TaxID=1641855 RepID=UPI00131BCA85|nr:hypothetical protein [Beijerinckia sp. L45]